MRKQEDSSQTLRTLLFYEADLDVGPGKPHKTRRQRRQDKFLRTAVDPSGELTPELPLGFNLPTDVVQMQQGDASLVPCFQKALEARNAQIRQDGGSEGRYFEQNGVLYRQIGQVKQLVVPQTARETVLVLGHSVPWVGHLGKHKTIARIQRNFYWPGLRAEVGPQFCRSCPQCQRTAPRGPARVPLQPLPIIGTLFDCLGMDIVGPVERSKSGYRFMLVITDYATRYPEVFPLKSIIAKSVAFCLVQFFFQGGVSPGDTHGSRNQLYVQTAKGGVPTARHQKPADYALSSTNGWVN